jgi:hypothetical protein
MGITNVVFVRAEKLAFGPEAREKVIDAARAQLAEVIQKEFFEAAQEVYLNAACGARASAPPPGAWARSGSIASRSKAIAFCARDIDGCCPHSKSNHC